MAATILYGRRETTIPGAHAERDRLWVPFADLERATGWTLKPQGLCLADVCVPVPSDRKAEWIDEKAGRLNLLAFARHMGQPVVHHEAHGAYSFGEPARAGAEVGGSGPVMAPDFSLPDLEGRMHSLSDYRGKKVLLFCWASW